MTEVPKPEPVPNLARVDDDFVDEYPGADPLSSELYVNIVRVGDQLDAELSRRLRVDAGISLRAFAVLATIDGLGGRATSAEISSHISITTAAITSLVDTCQKHGWVERVPDAADRRKIQIHTTEEARALLDRLLPGIHQLEASVLSQLADDEKKDLIRLLGKVSGGVASAATEDPHFVDAPRRRPARLKIQNP